MPSLNTFTILGDEVWINREGWKSVAITTYDERYYSELSNVTWTENNGYLVQAKFGSLHRYVMRKWYGDEVFNTMTMRNCVVDHMDNNGFNCKISNLEFLLKPRNTAKGLTIDQSISDLQLRIAIGIYKDFTTGMYQIGLGFNDPIYKISGDQYLPVQSLYFLYSSDYEEVLLDAERIISDYTKHNRIDLNRLTPVEHREVLAEQIELTQTEIDEIEHQGRVFVERDGNIHFIPGKNCWLKSTGFIKGWTPHK